MSTQKLLEDQVDHYLDGRSFLLTRVIQQLRPILNGKTRSSEIDGIAMEAFKDLCKAAKEGRNLGSCVVI